MTIKEKPYIDAGGDADALPSFLFVNTLFTGFFCMLMCAVFGALMSFFGFFGRGVVDAGEIFEVVRWGAVAGLIVGSAALVVVFLSAALQRDQGRVDRLLFVLGGIFGIAALAVADRLYVEELRAWISTLGPLVEKVV